MKEATGVHTATAVIEKFVAQEETHSALAMLSREAHGKIQSLQKEREAARQRLVDARYATSDGVARVASREAATLTDIEAEIGEERLRKMRGRQRAQRSRRVGNLLVEARTAIEHLHAVFETTAKLPPPRRRAAAAEADGAAAATDRGLTSDAELGALLSERMTQFVEPAAASPTPTPPPPLSPPPRRRRCRGGAGRRRAGAGAGAGARGGGGGGRGGGAYEVRLNDVWHPLAARVVGGGGGSADGGAAQVGARQPAHRLRRRGRRRRGGGRGGDPENPTDPVLDRETLKYRAQEYVRKRTKVAGKKGRKGKGEERPGSA